jgi:signal transduction histidine kinase
MFTSLYPEHLHKDWLLHLSGFLIWLVVSFLFLNSLEVNLDYFINTVSFIGFYILFAWSVSAKKGTHVFRRKLLIAGQILIIFPLIYDDTHGVAAILLVLIATQLPSLLQRKKALLLIFALSAVHFILVFTGSFVDTFFQVLIFFMLQVFGFSSLEIMLREQQAKDELAVINQELLATRFMLKTSSQKQERLRISRDLHDVIGHQLTALYLNLEVASHKVPEQFKPLLQNNVQLAKTLLGDVRQVVKEMRDEEQFDLTVSLNSLVNQLLGCQLIIQSPLHINSLRLKQQLLYCLQEGISNALRHGKAKQLVLINKRIEDYLVIELMDDGIGLQENNPCLFGNGLTGMEERLVDFMGTVQLNNNSKGKSGSILKLTVKDCYD